MAHAGVIEDPSQGVIGLKHHEGFSCQLVETDKLTIGQRVLAFDYSAQLLGEEFSPLDSWRVIECHRMIQTYIDDTIG